MDYTELCSQLEKRYAVKEFDKEKSEDINVCEEMIKNILRLAPSSFGIQAQKFLIIKDDIIRKKLREFSWNQSQITDSYMVIVFCIPSDFNKDSIIKATDRVQEIRGTDNETKIKRVAFLLDKIITNGSEIGIYDIDQWLSKQLYLTLGSLLTALAVLEIDCCPIEGFNALKYDEILGLSDKNLRSKVVLTIGVKSSHDSHQNAKKVRSTSDELFEYY